MNWYYYSIEYLTKDNVEIVVVPCKVLGIAYVVEVLDSWNSYLFVLWQYPSDWCWSPVVWRTIPSDLILCNVQGNELLYLILTHIYNNNTNIATNLNQGNGFSRRNSILWKYWRIDSDEVFAVLCYRSHSMIEAQYLADLDGPALDSEPESSDDESETDDFDHGQRHHRGRDSEHPEQHSSWWSWCSLL